MTDTVAGAPLPKLSWRRLAACDLPDLTALYARALATDGGQPFAADEWLLRRWYIEGVKDARAALIGDRLAGVCAWRYTGAATADADAHERRAVIVGLVDPEHRRRGLGGRLLDIPLESLGAEAAVRVETESLGAGADALYRSRGLTCVFAEDVMTRPLTDRLPEATTAVDLAFTEWSDSVAERFFAVYEASFRERPGFPGWTAAEWISHIGGDDDFRPDWTLLARTAGADVGFVVCDAGGWIAQVGVVPSARRHAVASTLIVEVLRRMRAGGEARAVLNVNVNNPGAVAAYRQLGFRPAGRRARYEPARLAAPWQPR